MLSKSDLYFNYRALEIISKLNLLPILFDFKTGETKWQNSKFRVTLWKLLTLLLSFNATYKLIRMIQSFHQTSDFNLVSCSFNFMICCHWLDVIYIDLAIFNDHGVEATYLISLLHRENVAEDSELTEGTGALKNTLLSLHKRGFLEMTIIMLPTTLFLCHGFCLLVLAVDPEANYLLYASLPEHYQTKTYFALTFALEAFSYALCFSPRYFTVYYILNILPRLKDVFRKLTSQYLSGSKSDGKGLKYLCGDLKKVQTEIKLINNVYSGLLYMDKLVLLLIVITGMSAGIYYLNVNPVFSGTIIVLSVYSGVVLYVCLYGKLYEIPDGIEDLKQKLLSYLCREGITGKSYVVKAIAGIPVCGLKAGSFYVLDRVTGPTFVDFVLRQVASLLIAFK